MFPRFFLFFFLLFSQVDASGLSQILFNSCGGPSQPLLEALEYFGISHDGSWKTIVDETQKKWIQTGERWEFNMIDDPNPEQTFCHFSKLWMTQTIWNQGCRYEYGAVLGTIVQVARQRIWFLKEVWDKGVRFNKLVIFTGDRPLSSLLETEEALIDPNCSPYPFRNGWKFDGKFPKNEIEMMKLIFDQLDLPCEWRSMPIIFVDTPAPEEIDRPRTFETFIHWLKENPKPGPLLIVSNQPFIGRQDATAHNYFTFEIETIGEGFSFEEYHNVPQGKAILLNELGWWIYEAVARESSFKSSPCL